MLKLNSTLPQFILLLSLLFCLTACPKSLGKKRILIIGDSNAAGQGWAFQFQQIRNGGPLVNTAAGGNTIGFDGMDDPKLNTLNQLVVHLRRGYAEMGGMDEIIIGLGTNDCKQIYERATAERHVNYRKLINDITAFFAERGQELPRIVLVSPPPIASDDDVIDEFNGAAACVAEMGAFLRKLALEKGFCYVDLLENPGSSLLDNSTDGIHFNALGYEIIAQQIVNSCY